MKMLGNKTQVENIELGLPVPPTNLVLLEVNDSVTISFDTPTDEFINDFEIWSSPINESNYGLVSVVEYSEVTGNNLMVIDNTYERKGLMHYKVYSVKNGLRSNPLKGQLNINNNVPDPTGLRVFPDTDAFWMEFILPDDRRLSHIEIKKHATQNLADLNEGSSTLVYSGITNTFTYEILVSEREFYHQFWVSSITKG